MGFFDTVRDKAGSIAADAERAGKVTAAQARLVVLQNDLRKAERELGHAAFALVERGELDHPDLAHAVERLRATAAEVRAKEAEISALRGEQLEMTTAAAGTAASASAEAGAGTVAGTAARPEPTTAVIETATGPMTVTSAPPPVAEEAPPAAAPTEEQPAAADVPEEPPASDAASEDTPEAANGEDVAGKPKPRLRTTKGGAGAAAGATPKKTPRPSSRPRRPKAGKKPDKGPH